MNCRFINNPPKRRITKLFLFLNTVLILFSIVSIGGGALRGQTPKITATEPAANPTAEQRFEYEKKAKFLTDRLRPNSDGEWLNWADETDRCEIIRRFEESVKWWHAADRHIEEYEALTEVAGSYAALNDFQAALGIADRMLAAAREAKKPVLFSALQTANQVKAEKLMEEAATLQKANTNAAKRRALAKYKQAAALLRNNRPPGDFIALSNIAKLYKELNEPDRAIDYWQQSLARLRGAKDRKPDTAEAEGVTLLQIGAVYDERGNRVKALEHYRQAFDLTRAIKGYAAAGALNSILTLHIKAKQPERAAAFLEQEIARARTVQDAETEKALSEILNQIKNGTFKN